MDDNDSLTVIAKITSIVVASLSALLVNNRFVLGRCEAHVKAVKAELNKQDEKITAVETQHQNDRKEIFALFEKAVEKSEKRLKEHITLAIKADKVDTFNQSGRG